VKRNRDLLADFCRLYLKCRNDRERAVVADGMFNFLLRSFSPRIKNKAVN